MRRNPKDFERHFRRRDKRVQEKKEDDIELEA